ncbi:MAG: tRNA (adenosine(37)-N6)-dimethylallyltransferase MiaA [Zoogloeaceae bacterium]|nr:tRNA (adenosine(37)-N6)-dimethylallyltransferase MiaA [Zoogloeaceae bacterium]
MSGVSARRVKGQAKPLPPAILLAGPTASGKTALSFSLCRRFPLEIVSVDSALVFRDMNIGTAKPDAATLARYPHRLIDLIGPEERYSAARFREDALAAMEEISAAGKIPLLVGGTMLYFKALLEGLADLPRADPGLRAAIDRAAKERGWPALHRDLMALDPVTAARLDPADSQRIQRALEVCRIAGRPMSALLAEQRAEAQHPPYRFLSLALLPSERSALHERIARRFHAMLAEGLIEEVEELRQRYRLTPDLPSMRAVGYRQVWSYLEGEYDRAELAERGIFATRQLAKRQITWLANTLSCESFDCLDARLEDRIAARVGAEIGA